MSYRLKKNEPLAPGIRRIAREQLEKAISEIKGRAHQDKGAAVHATRKHLKKIRALLRLVRREIGPEIFKGENQRLRDVARNFLGSRDARVQLQVLEQLRDGAEQEKSSFSKTTEALETAIADVAETFGAHRRQAATALQQICDRLEGWPLENLGSDDLCGALQRSYAQLAPERFGGLRDFQRLETGWDSPEEERAVLLGLICDRECELERVALDLGARFFAENPGAFGRRLLRYARRCRPARAQPNEKLWSRSIPADRRPSRRFSSNRAGVPERFCIDLAHEGDHVAQIANPRLRQVAFVGPLARPSRDFIELGLQPAQVSTAGAAQSPAQTNEIGNQ